MNIELVEHLHFSGSNETVVFAFEVSGIKLGSTRIQEDDFLLFRFFSVMI